MALMVSFQGRVGTWGWFRGVTMRTLMSRDMVGNEVQALLLGRLGPAANQSAVPFLGTLGLVGAQRPAARAAGTFLEHTDPPGI